MAAKSPASIFLRGAYRVIASWICLIASYLAVYLFVRSNSHKKN